MKKLGPLNCIASFLGACCYLTSYIPLSNIKLPNSFTTNNLHSKITSCNTTSIAKQIVSRGNTQICPLKHVRAGQKGAPAESDSGLIITLYQTQNQFKVFNFIFASPSAGRLYIPFVASSDGQEGREQRKEYGATSLLCTLPSFFNIRNWVVTLTQCSRCH